MLLYNPQCGSPHCQISKCGKELTQTNLGNITNCLTTGLGSLNTHPSILTQDRSLFFFSLSKWDKRKNQAQQHSSKGPPARGPSAWVEQQWESSQKVLIFQVSVLTSSWTDMVKQVFSARSLYYAWIAEEWEEHHDTNKHFNCTN